MDLSDIDIRRVHLTYRLGSGLSGGSVLFVPAKHYDFTDPKLSLSVNGDEVTITSEAYARSVEVYSQDGYVRFDDNYFDMEKGSRTIRLLEGENKDLRVRSVKDIG